MSLMPHEMKMRLMRSHPMDPVMVHPPHRVALYAELRSALEVAQRKASAGAGSALPNERASESVMPPELRAALDRMLQNTDASSDPIASHSAAPGSAPEPEHGYRAGAVAPTAWPSVLRAALEAMCAIDDDEWGRRCQCDLSAIVAAWVTRAEAGAPFASITRRWCPPAEQALFEAVDSRDSAQAALAGALELARQETRGPWARRAGATALTVVRWPLRAVGALIKNTGLAIALAGAVLQKMGGAPSEELLGRLAAFRANGSTGSNGASSVRIIRMRVRRNPDGSSGLSIDDGSGE